MNSDDHKQELKAAYQRGYQTGLKTKSKRELQAEKTAEKIKFRREVYVAVLAQLVTNNHSWGKTVGGKHVKYTEIDDLTGLAQEIAVISMRHF